MIDYSARPLRQAREKYIDLQFFEYLLQIVVYSSFFNKEKSAERKIDNKTLKIKATKKPETANPLTKLSAKRMITALITNKNNPKVTMVAGSVKNINSGRTNIFKIAITTATIKAVPYPSTVTPGNILASTTTARAVKINFKKVFIIYFYACNTKNMPLLRN